ncbi:MAG: D-glycerate dehydrogenase [Dehalococcoidia bacterium]
MDKPRVCVALPLADEAMARIAAACDVRMIPARPGEPPPPEVADAEGVLCGAPYTISQAFLDAAPRLRVVSNFGVGYDNVDLAEMARRGIAVCNTPGVLSGAVADLTIGLIIAAARRVVDHALFVRERQWGQAPPAPLGVDLAGKTLGIVGLGRIGRAVARRARGFDMRLVYHDTFTDPGDADRDCVYRPLDDLLREADFVTIHTNLTPETRHLIGSREFGLMKPTAYLVNTARGPVVDQQALAAALRDGRIAGAALDVLEVEPPPANDPILDAPNVVVLPHVGSATIETRQAMLEMAIDNLLAVLRGDEPRACVNPEVLETARKRR